MANKRSSDKPADALGEHGQERTPITDFGQAFARIDEMSQNVTRLATMLPVLSNHVEAAAASADRAREAANEASQEATLARAGVEDLGRRVACLETEARDSRDARATGVAVTTRVDDMSRRLDERDAGRRWGLGIVASVALAALLAGGSAIAFVARLDERVRVAPSPLQALPTAVTSDDSDLRDKDAALTRQDVEAIVRDLKRENGGQVTFESWYQSLTPPEKRALVHAVKPGRVPDTTLQVRRTP